jgi:hypothetical protein
MCSVQIPSQVEAGVPCTTLPDLVIDSGTVDGLPDQDEAMASGLNG